MDEDVVARLDTFIDEAAEKSFPEVIQAVAPSQRDSFSAQAVDRLFDRRIAEYAAAAGAIEQGSETRDGIEALASLFPTPLWISYWNILFGTRTNASVRAEILNITDKWEAEIMRWFPRFFPAGTDGGAIDVVAVQVDALALRSVERGNSYERSAHIDGIVAFLESWQGIGAQHQDPDPTARNASLSGDRQRDARMEEAVERIVSTGANTGDLDIADLRVGRPTAGAAVLSDQEIVLTVTEYILQQQATEAARAAEATHGSATLEERLRSLLDLYVQEAHPDRLWLAFHDLMFRHRTSAIWTQLQALEERHRPSIESTRWSILDSSASDAAIRFALRHLDGLALWSLFVPSEEALAVPSHLAALGAMLAGDAR